MGAELIALFYWQVTGQDWDFRAESLARAKLYYTNTLLGKGAELQRKRREERNRARYETYENAEAAKKARAGYMSVHICLEGQGSAARRGYGARLCERT